jgi:REP element-mobilizing transposase RayT
MPRQPRFNIPNVLHHVIVRGIEKRDIFADDADKEHFVARLSSLLTKTSMNCYAWSLMSNHFHLLLMPSAVSLSEFMRRLLTGYAVYFNRKYKRAGHLFQNRYKSILCEEEPYFLELVRYIHLNPLRAGLVKDLNELDRYPWSGHAVLLGHRTVEGQESGEVLARFGNGRQRSLLAYRQFIADGMSKGRRDELIGGGLKRSLLGCEESQEFQIFDERILGSGDFVETVTGCCKKQSKNAPLALPELLRKVSEAIGVDVERVKKIGKERILARARAVFCYLAVYEYGYTGKEAGITVGLRSAGVSIAVRRGEELLKNDSSVRQLIEETVLAS